MKKFFTGLLAGILMATASTALAAEQYVQVVFAKFNFMINGEKVDPGADPLVYQGTTYLPVRVISNMLGYDVTYRADSRTIEFLGPANTNVQRGATEMTETETIIDTAWISLRDLGEQYNLMIRQTTEDGKVYGIFRGDDIVLTILYDNKALSASASTPTGESVGATVENNRVLLNLNDLKAAGIIQ